MVLERLLTVPMLHDWRNSLSLSQFVNVDINATSCKSVIGNRSRGWHVVWTAVVHDFLRARTMSKYSTEWLKVSEPVTHVLHVELSRYVFYCAYVNY